MNRVVVLDNEAVVSLRHPAHPKHRRVLAHVQVVAQRRRRAVALRLVVPTAVRAEAGWAQTSAAWAFVNGLRIADVPLDAVHTDVAAAIRGRTGVSVADAHLGAVVHIAVADSITVLTSDPSDLRAVAGHRPVIVVVI